MGNAVFVFFVQAEDGIRDLCVTGVQTCALPIYRAARFVIWLGFACNLAAVAAIQLAIALPPAGFWEGRQSAYDDVLGQTWRIFAASFAAYLVGEFANAFVLARMKVATRGRFLWSRTIGSTVVGEG